MTAFESGAATDVGQVRAHNEDTFVVAGTVFVVADGMGGHNGGEIASRIAVDRLAAIGPVNSINVLVRGVQEANSDIRERAREQPEFRGMGTTVVMLAAIERAGSHRLGMANVGDSRLYRLTDSGLHQHTEDHSLVEALVRDGRLTRAEAAVHPQRNIVTRALGIDDKVLVDAWELIPVAGDRYVLCSDGLFGEIDDGEIHEVLQATSSPQDAADELVRRACEAGGRDNITVVVVDVVEADPGEAYPLDPAEHGDALGALEAAAAAHLAATLPLPPSQLGAQDWGAVPCCDSGFNVTEAAALNGVADRVDVAAFDVTRRGAPLPPAEIVLLGDLLYLTDLTAAVAQRVAEAAARGSVVLLADSRRTHQEQLVRALGELGVEASFEERTLSSGEAVSLLQYQIS